MTKPAPEDLETFDELGQLRAYYASLKAHDGATGRYLNDFRSDGVVGHVMFSKITQNHSKYEILKIKINDIMTNPMKNPKLGKTRPKTTNRKRKMVRRRKRFKADLKSWRPNWRLFMKLLRRQRRKSQSLLD